MKHNPADQDLLCLPEALQETIGTLEILCAIIGSYELPDGTLDPLEEQLTRYRQYREQLTAGAHHE